MVHCLFFAFGQITLAVKRNVGRASPGFAGVYLLLRCQTVLWNIAWWSPLVNPCSKTWNGLSRSSWKCICDGSRLEKPARAARPLNFLATNGQSGFEIFHGSQQRWTTCLALHFFARMNLFLRRRKKLGFTGALGKFLKQQLKAQTDHYCTNKQCVSVPITHKSIVSQRRSCTTKHWLT